MTWLYSEACLNLKNEMLLTLYCNLVFLISFYTFLLIWIKVINLAFPHCTCSNNSIFVLTKRKKYIPFLITQILQLFVCNMTVKESMMQLDFGHSPNTRIGCDNSITKRFAELNHSTFRTGPISTRNLSQKSPGVFILVQQFLCGFLYPLLCDKFGFY